MRGSTAQQISYWKPQGSGDVNIPGFLASLLHSAFCLDRRWTSLKTYIPKEIYNKNNGFLKDSQTYLNDSVRDYL